MATVTEYADHRAELEEKLRALEAEKATLESDISSLKEKIATYELEKAANVLEGEVEALKTEKAVLEEKAASFESQEPYQLPPSISEGLQA
jgi:predicted  nucleic acid-binding Zn-ribbon protein